MIFQSLFEKLWYRHLVHETEDGIATIYIDRHFMYEVTSPQAFEGLRQTGRKPWRADTILATSDHNVPTTSRVNGVADELSRVQIVTLEKNCAEFEIREFGINDPRQGIIHVIGPEQGATLPGMSIVAGDSHTSTHGAFATLAFGVGTSDVEHVLVTQSILMKKPKSMRVCVEGVLGKGVTAKDLILAIIRQIGAGGATGYAIEFAGSAISALSMEGRMTLCNMAIEAGARLGLVGVDEKTIDYIKGRPMAPSGPAWHAAARLWRTLVSDPDAQFDKAINVDATAVRPLVTWGTSPGMVAAIDGFIPDPESEPNAVLREAMLRALAYMGLRANQPITGIALDKIFIGSCTNARIEDLRAAAEVLRGRHIASNIKQALVVPGSGLVKRQAEEEGLDRIFIDAGFEWREPGCSMCLGMNEDRLSAGERCASTSNRNFEGRQGHGGRTHLVSPPMAAAAAIEGRFVDVACLS